ncbi:DUF4386 family protein [Nocardioides limicola]|uniref:DUF4386 family protein n=1 Tax=Nocardioides limicola TaxID=2803368 RepID=UPI00193BA2A3|nr:DUF4386 family protein [Nocardioides sp. DJM-14]
MNQRHRLLPLTGIAAAALWTTGLVLFRSARSDDPTTADEILAHYQANGDTIVLAVLAALLGSVFFLVFLSCLYTRLRESQGPRGQLAPTVLAAGTAVAIGQFAVYSTDFDAALDSAKYPLSSTTAEVYFYSGDLWFVGAAAMAGLMLICTGAIALGTRALPRWFGWVSLVLAVPLLLPPLAPDFMFYGFPAWIAVASVLLGGRERTSVSDHSGMPKRATVAP